MLPLWPPEIYTSLHTSGSGLQLWFLILRSNSLTSPTMANSQAAEKYPPFKLDHEDGEEDREMFKGRELTPPYYPAPNAFKRAQLNAMSKAQIRGEMQNNGLSLTKTDEQIRYALKQFYESKLVKVDPIIEVPEGEGDASSNADSNASPGGRKKSTVSAKSTTSVSKDANGDELKKSINPFWKDQAFTPYHGNIFAELADKEAHRAAFIGTYTKLIDEADRPKLCELMQHVGKIKIIKTSNEMRGELEGYYQHKIARFNASGYERKT